MGIGQGKQTEQGHIKLSERFSYYFEISHFCNCLNQQICFAIQLFKHFKTHICLKCLITLMYTITDVQMLHCTITNI